jgi:hypothetical protein
MWQCAHFSREDCFDGLHAAAWQGQAEFYLEKLHALVETQLNKFVDGTAAPSNWGKFRESLIGLTDVTRAHFDKLVSELVKGVDAMLSTYQIGALAMGLERAESLMGRRPCETFDC